MSEDEDILGALAKREGRPSPWVVAAFLASCVFTAGILLLVILTWR